MGKKFSPLRIDPIKLGWKITHPPLDCCCVRATDSGVHAPDGVPGVETGRTRGLYGVDREKGDGEKMQVGR